MEDHQNHLNAPPPQSNVDHMGHDMSGMHPGFHFGSKEMILFSFWNISSPIGLIISCFLVLGGCVLLESIRWFRVHRTYAQTAENLTAQNSGRRQIDAYLITDTILHAVQLTLVYFAMLIFMTFNVWLCATIIVSEVVTHLAFRIFLPHLDNTALSTTSTQPCCG